MEETLGEIGQRIRVCKKCPLHESRTKPVPGEGNPFAKVMLVGQGPGRNEDETGRPFVGAAGVFLDRMLKAVGLKRRELWLTNVTRCLPPGGRLPRAPEIKTCAPFLLDEIRVLRPKIVCPLGNKALSLLLRKPSQIQRLRGTAIPMETHFLFPMLHPAAAIRNPALEEKVMEDFKNLKRFLDSDPVLKPPPGQESLF
ncbi:MAG: uracil-DNA glycosylase [FCB group bacterium]|nr:uracil-DNA glycosylase [FCB group bacterium]